MEKIYFPIQIVCDQKSVKISDGVYLKRLDAKDCKKNLSIESITFKDGHVASLNPKKDNLNKWGYLRSSHPNRDIISNMPNFALVVDEFFYAEKFLFSLKLNQFTKSGPFRGFTEKSVHFMTSCPYWGGGVAIVDKKSARNLRKIFNLIDVSDKKLKTIMDRFIYLESEDCRSVAQKFFELMVILEMIFLPDKLGELSYRFCLRLSKWLHKYWGEDLEKTYRTANRFYKLRSDFVHKGSCEVGLEDLNAARAMVRIVLSFYLKDKALFDNERLNTLCLLGR